MNFLTRVRKENHEHCINLELKFLHCHKYDDDLIWNCWLFLFLFHMIEVQIWLSNESICVTFRSYLCCEHELKDRNILAFK